MNGRGLIDGIPLGVLRFGGAGAAPGGTGTPVRLSWSWFFIAGVIVLLFGPRLAAGGLGAAGHAVAASYAVCLAASVLVHEAAHAWAGARHRQHAEEIVLTLWGGHTQFRRSLASPRATVLVAVAGPAANLVVGVLAWTVLTVFDMSSVPRLLLEMTAWANLLLGGFNLLPGTPLDGGRVVEAAVWARTGSRARGLVVAGQAGRVVAVCLVVAVLVPPLLPGVTAPSWWILAVLATVCATLWQGAGHAVRHGKDALSAEALDVAAHIRPARAVSAHLSVAQARTLAGAQTLVVLADDDRPVGLVDAAALARVPEAQAAHTPLGAAAVALGPGALVVAESLSAAGPDLIDRLRGTETAQWVVLDHEGRVLGVLPRAALPTLSRPAGRGPRRRETS